ncbi:MAG: gamma carbonic anhydrase family protein [Pseudomonadota bacterium]
MALYALDNVTPKVPSSDRYWVAENATVLGNVTLMEDSSIWFNAVLRGDNEPIIIGERSNIQDGSVLHTDPGCPLTVGQNVTVGHMAMLHGCAIGNNSLVGIGAIILNRAVIGENCLIGAHALIPEGKVIPDNSLVVGAPGKVVRSLSDTDRAMLSTNAQVYVNNWQRFKSGFEQIEP